jgi:Helix-turn-helix domain
MDIKNALYTVAETASILRTGQARIRLYVRDGMLEARKHGRRILVTGNSIARYLNSEKADTKDE